MHHILIIQDGEDADDARRVNAPGFDDELATIVLLVDETTMLAAKAGSQDGMAVDAVFTWSTKDAAIADVDALTGVVTGQSNGSTMITATAVGRGIEVDVPVTVYKSVDTVAVTADGSGPMRVGDTRGLTATALDESDADTGVVIPGIEFVWESSDESIATVKADKDNSAMATVTAKGAGDATITVTAAGTDADAEYDVSVFAVQGVERRLTADVPYSATIAADSSSVTTGATITVTLEQKGRRW